MRFISLFLFTLTLTACTGFNKSKGVESNKVITTSDYAAKMMDRCSISSKNMSQIKKRILVSQITRVAEQYLPDQTSREAFITLICIESHFDQTAKSSVGAIGLTQVMPKYIKDFARTCNIEVNAEDAYDSEINLILGACYFSSLLKDEDIGGNVGLALGAYNAGKYGDTFKKLSKLQAINNETANYLGKFLVLREAMDKELIATK
jgi:hypothetical protein